VQWKAWRIPFVARKVARFKQQPCQCSQAHVLKQDRHLLAVHGALPVATFLQPAGNFARLERSLGPGADKATSGAVGAMPGGEISGLRCRFRAMLRNAAQRLHRRTADTTAKGEAT
jgi:hypothetical protein